MRSIKRRKGLEKLFRLWFILTAQLALSSCARVKINDHEFCGDAGSQGAICFHTLTPETRDIPKARWDDERFGQICENADTFADWKSVIEKLCSYSNDCDYATKKNLEAFFKRVDEFKSAIPAERNLK